MGKISGAEILVTALKKNGVKRIYGVVGIPVTDFARLAQNEGIDYVGFRREDAAVNAAGIPTSIVLNLADTCKLLKFKREVWYDDGESMRDGGESIRNDGESMRIEVKQYGSETCAPCVAIRRKLEEWQRAHPMVNYSYLPIEDHQEEAAQKGILSVPTVIAVIDGTEVAREARYFSLDKMLAQLERYMKMAGETEL